MICDMLRGRYGWQLEPADLLELARQTIRDEKEFNRQAGFTPAHDKLPDFFRDEVNPATGTTWDVTDAELQTVHNF